LARHNRLLGCNVSKIVFPSNFCEFSVNGTIKVGSSLTDAPNSSATPRSLLYKAFYEKLLTQNDYPG
jgi:hypothetical protein